MRNYAALCALVTLSLTFVEGKVLNSLDELAKDEKYDFIVIGSGPGGGTVASRLSENPNFKVLLVEAGGNNEGIQDMAIPAHHGRINTKYSWEYVSTPQTGLGGRTVTYTQGRSLGGSSSINGQIYSRGSADDFNNWAKVTGDAGWSWDKLQPYIKKNERWGPPPGGRNVTGQYNPAVHGYEGNLAVSLSWGQPTEFEKLCLQSAGANEEFPYNVDFNSGKPNGLGWTPWTVGNGERSSSATAFLTKDVRARPNLTILLNTYALRASPSLSLKKLDFRTVELGTQAGAKTRKITANKEIIVSAGAFGSPRFLLNSGIGDAAELKKAGVKALHHLPDVGRGLSDHVGAANLWAELVPPQEPIDEEAALKQWETSRTGPLTEPHASRQILWSRIPSKSPLWEKNKDPSTGPDSPHIEIIPIGGGGAVGGLVLLLTPYSRGSVKINTTDPFSPPVVDLGFLTDPFDLEALKEGVKLTQRFFSGPVWDGYVGPAISPDPDADKSWEQQIRAGALGLWHPAGTAAMSSKNSKKGVVDAELKVKGVNGLRVVDAAALPFVPAAHSQTAVYILAERASDLIKGMWAKQNHQH